MAEFGSQATSAPAVQSFSNPREGVVERPALAQGLSNVFDMANDLATTAKAKKSATTVSNFTKRQLLVADALDQGRIRSSAHAKTLMRKNLLDAIDANPTLASDLIQAQRDILGIAGGAQLVDEGTRQEQLKHARQDQLIRENIVPYDASEEEFNQLDQEFLTAQEAERRFNTQMQTLDMAMKAENLSKAKREALESQRQVETENYIRNTHVAQFHTLKGRFESVLQSYASEAEKEQAISEIYTGFLSETSAVLGDLSSHKYSAFLKPFEMLQEDYAARARGDMTDAEVKRSIDRTLNLAQKIALSDPIIANIAVSSKLISPDILSKVIMDRQSIYDPFTRFIAGNSPNNDGQIEKPSPYRTDVDGKKAFKEYMNTVAKGLDSEETREESAFQLRSVFESFEEFEGLVRKNPEGAIGPAEFFASYEFLNARRNHPEVFDGLESSVDVLERYYADEVWGMVQREFKQNEVITLPSVNDFSVDENDPDSVMNIEPTPEAVGYRSTPSGMEFYPIDPDNNAAFVKARRLNAELKPIINTTIRAFAHLNGDSNYKAAWESVAETMLGGDGQEDVQGGAGSDFLNVEDYYSVDDLPSEFEPLLELIDQTEAGGNYDTLLGHAQNSVFNGMKASEMTVDQVIAFQQSPEYRNYSKGVVGRVATPVGRFQIVGTTLRSLKDAMNLTGGEKFDEAMQNRMFLHLVQQRLKAAGGDINKVVSQLRKEWAGLGHVSTKELKKAVKDLS